MKRNLLVIAAVCILALGSTAAFAQHRGGGHWNGGYMNNGCMMMDGQGYGVGGEIASLTADQAKARVQEFVTVNYKGYKLGDVVTQTNPRGFNMYAVKATDASGNGFVFIVGPRGHVNGPVLESEYNRMVEFRTNNTNSNMMNNNVK